VILVPPDVKESLSWLDFTENEQQILDFIYGTSLMVRKYGGDENIVLGIRGCWEAARLASELVGNDWAQFIEEKLFSADELRLLVSDESPFYGLTVKKPLSSSERFSFLMSDVAKGSWAPLRMRNFWEAHLARYGGDYLEARVALEFIEPPTR
jgi:hypothetical protein